MLEFLASGAKHSQQETFLQFSRNSSSVHSDFYPQKKCSPSISFRESQRISHENGTNLASVTKKKNENIMKGFEN